MGITTGYRMAVAEPRHVHGPTSDEHVVDAEALQEVAALAGRARTALIQVQQKCKRD